ncbi:hypothetical protein NX059_005424 [Plenodomus lindquistii]|nr:hypothetical protein NX059_005424 [Plenodomus lindquistii]
MSFKSTMVAAMALLASVNAHIKLKQPVPFSASTLDTAPITKSQYPCKSNLGFTVSTMNSMKVGEPQTVIFDGTAVHQGGSCQLSVSLDPEPNENSVFKVIKSIEGGCPGVEAAPNKYEFTLPDSIPNGKATFAWSWFAKMSGVPEMYMNCAPLDVTGGASDDSAFQKLPDMLKANLDDTCESETNFAIKFPNPGTDVQMGTTDDAKPPIGAACGSSSGATPSEPSGSPGAGPSSAPSPSAAPPNGQYTPAPGAPSAAPTQPGGVFAPGASSAAPVVPSASPVAPPLGTGTMTTLVTVTAKPTVAKPTGTGSPAVPTTPSSPSPPSEGGSAGTCTSEGAIVCNGTTQFGLCNGGKVVWQAVASGTTCTNGVIAKRGYNGRIARPRFNSPRIAVGN